MAISPYFFEPAPQRSEEQQLSQPECYGASGETELTRHLSSLTKQDIGYWIPRLTDMFRPLGRVCSSCVRRWRSAREWREQTRKIPREWLAFAHTLRKETAKRDI